MRRWLRFALALLVVIVVLVGGAVGWIAWRLQQGPVALDVLMPRVKAALAEGVEGWNVDLEGLELTWAAAARLAELRARGIHIARPDGGDEVRLDSLRVRLRRSALLRGAIVVTAVEFDGPALRLVRNVEGHLELERGPTTGAESGEARNLDWFWTMLRRLEHVAVRNGSITFIDEETQTVWKMPGVEGDLWRTTGPIRMGLTTGVVADDTTIPLHFEGIYRPERGTLTVQASSPGAETAAAFAAWPSTLAPEAHAWVTTHLQHGRIGNAILALDGHVVRDGDAELVVDRLAASVEFAGLTVRYVPTMLPVTAVVGRADFTAHGVDIAVDSGRLEALDVRGGRVRIAWPHGKPARIAIEAGTHGPLASLLDVLDHEPVTLGERLGIARHGVEGAATTHVRLAFPLKGRPGLGTLGLRGKAAISDAAIPKIAGDRDLRRGMLDVSVTDHAVSVDGSGELHGVPIALRIRDQLRRPGRRRLAVVARLDAAQRAALDLDPGTWLTGPVDASVRLARTADGRVVADVDVDLTPAGIALPALAVRKAAGDAGRAVARLALERNAVTAVERFQATAGIVTVRGSATREPGGGTWREAEAHASFALVDRPVDPPAAELVLRRRSDGPGWVVGLDTRDVGGCLRAYGYENARGGRMTFEGTADLAAAGLPLDGHLSVDAVTFFHVPWMVKLVSLASLKGLLDLRSEQDVEIDRLVATIAHRPPSTVEVRDLVASGPKMGFKLAGTIDHATDAVQFEGMLVPKYYLLNEGADRIPVIGGIVSLATAGAVQAVTFTVRGTRAEPVVAVQPLSSLAPGVLREWLRKLGW